MYLIIYKKLKFQHYKNHLTYTFFLVSSVLFLSVFITGERMALLLILASIFIMLIGMILDKILSYQKDDNFVINFFLWNLYFAYSFPDATQRAYFSTIEKIFNWRTSDYGLVWQSAYDVWMQSPVFGVGLHKYRESCENLGIYGSSYLNAIGSGVCFHPHNISLQLLSETGIIGFLVFYLMVCDSSIFITKNIF